MHHFNQMSQYEKLSISDLLKQENLCAKKLSAYVNQVQDPQIRSALSQYQNLCQQHMNMLNNLMQQAGQAGAQQVGGSMPNPTGGPMT
jgi:conjugal transfer/entry exclusion protein